MAEAVEGMRSAACGGHSWQQVLTAVLVRPVTRAEVHGEVD